MATTGFAFVHDQNMALEFKGNAVKESNKAPKSKKNASFGRRKALADLSNSTKPGAHHSVAKNLQNKPIGVYGDNAASKQKGKVGGRKALADISNSSSTSIHKVPTQLKNQKPVLDEQFQHDHQQCISMQKEAMDVNSMLRTLGLDGGTIWSPSSRVRSLQAKAKMVQTPLKDWDELEIAEIPEEVQTPYKCSSPKLAEDVLSSPEFIISPLNWNVGMTPKFALVDTPFLK